MSREERTPPPDERKGELTENKRAIGGGDRYSNYYPTTKIIQDDAPAEPQPQPPPAQDDKR